MLSLWDALQARNEMVFAMFQARPAMKRTAEQVVQEWRDSGSTDWGQLVSAINYWAMTDMCPELNAAQPAASERESGGGAAKGQEPR